jgi:hypothetical protein
VRSRPRRAEVPRPPVDAAVGRAGPAAMRAVAPRAVSAHGRCPCGRRCRVGVRWRGGGRGGRHVGRLCARGWRGGRDRRRDRGRHGGGDRRRNRCRIRGDDRRRGDGGGAAAGTARRGGSGLLGRRCPTAGEEEARGGRQGGEDDPGTGHCESPLAGGRSLSSPALRMSVGGDRPRTQGDGTSKRASRCDGPVTVLWRALPRGELRRWRPSSRCPTGLPRPRLHRRLTRSGSRSRDGQG